MRNPVQKAFALLILLLLCSCFEVSAYAETVQASSGVITDFEPLGDAGMIETEFKLALVTLEKRFRNKFRSALRAMRHGSLFR